MTRYELLDRIGVGGMAEIFRGKAVAAGGFEKPVAIKRILPHLSQDKRFVELLIAEAKVLSLLKHRNIVQIFDVGLGDDAQYFLVMEYVDGKDMGAVQRSLESGRRRIPFDLALHVGAEICEALEHAHAAKAPDGKPMSLVHRDVSPSNVLLSRAGEVKLTDFGIAKRAESEATGHGAVRGKFAYISPEQARNEHLDPRSDVFSVAILLWEMVTGRRLFSGLGDLEALRAVREAQVPRPSEVDRSLSAEVDALLTSALSRDVASRPTAGQFGYKLRSLRYSLEATVGDPATELAKIVDGVLSERPVLATPTARAEFEGTEATVIRIHTADEFSMRDKDGMGVARARNVINRFEEEETRQASLSRDQMAFLRKDAVRDSGELSVEPPLPGLRMAPERLDDDLDDVPGRARRITDEQTRANSPLDVPMFLSDSADPSQPFDSDATQLVAPPHRRTPPPERVGPNIVRRAGTQPPAGMQPQLRPTPPPPMPTSERRAPHPSQGMGPGSQSMAQPQMSAMPQGPAAMQQPAAMQPPAAMQQMPMAPQLPPPPGGMPPGHAPMQLPPGHAPMQLPPDRASMQMPPDHAPMQLPPDRASQPMQMPPGHAMQQPLPPASMQATLLGPGGPQMPPSMMQPGQPGRMQVGAPIQPMQPGIQPMQPGVQPMQPGMRPMMGPGATMPPPLGPQMPPGGYGPGWGQSPQGMFEQRPARARRPLKPWMLVLGALIMALLAFAVTRAFIHTTAKPATESR